MNKKNQAKVDTQRPQAGNPNSVEQDSKSPDPESLQIKVVCVGRNRIPKWEKESADSHRQRIALGHGIEGRNHSAFHSQTRVENPVTQSGVWNGSFDPASERSPVLAEGARPGPEVPTTATCCVLDS